MAVSDRMQHDIVTRLRELPTAAISDALDQAGIEGALHGIAPLSNDFRAVGPAFTVRYTPIDGTVGDTVGDFLDVVPPGAVIVIDNDGRTDLTVWGGIMTEIAAVRGIAGTVINGVCRDVSACLAQNYPLFSRGCFMRTGKDRVRLEAVGVPVTVSAIQIHPGTFICADADGVAPCPPTRGGSSRPPNASSGSRPTSLRQLAQAAPCARPARPLAITPCRRGSHDGHGTSGHRCQVRAGGPPYRWRGPQDCRGRPEW